MCIEVFDATHALAYNYSITANVFGGHMAILCGYGWMFFPVGIHLVLTVFFAAKRHEHFHRS